MGLVKGKLKDTLPDEKVQKIVSQTYFKPEEVQVLYQIFKTISAKNQDDGVIDMKEFQMAMGFENSDIARRIFKVFDKNGDKVISFKEFCQGLSVYTSKAPLEEKLQCTVPQHLTSIFNNKYLNDNICFIFQLSLR
jgi:Ca2+-binding EF-hand superfamily protein